LQSGVVNCEAQQMSVEKDERLAAAGVVVLRLCEPEHLLPVVAGLRSDLRLQRVEVLPPLGDCGGLVRVPLGGLAERADDIGHVRLLAERAEEPTRGARVDAVLRAGAVAEPPAPNERGERAAEKHTVHAEHPYVVLRGDDPWREGDAHCRLLRPVGVAILLKVLPRDLVRQSRPCQRVGRENGGSGRTICRPL
jgi:hypothetical protein